MVQGVDLSDKSKLMQWIFLRKLYNGRRIDQKYSFQKLKLIVLEGSSPRIFRIYELGSIKKWLSDFQININIIIPTDSVFIFN